MYTYDPPDVGIAVAISDLERALGRIKVAAKRKDNQTPPPNPEVPCLLIESAAKAGSTKSPDPSIADSEIMITPINPIDLSNGAE